jgi:hypothetical protein
VEVKNSKTPNINTLKFRKLLSIVCCRAVNEEDFFVGIFKAPPTMDDADIVMAEVCRQKKTGYSLVEHKCFSRMKE